MEFIVSIKVDSGWFALYKLRLLRVIIQVIAYVEESPPAVDSVGVNSKE